MNLIQQVLIEYVDRISLALEGLAGTQVVQEVNAQRAKFVPSAAAALGHRGRPGTGGGGGGGGGGGDALAELHPGGRLELQTAAGAKAFVPAAPVMDGKAPRFMATVVDQQGDAAERAVRLCGVFIVPQVGTLPK